MTRPEPVPCDDDARLSEEQRRELLLIARSTIEAHLATGLVPTFDPPDPRLARPGAVFSTLTRAGRLRGCMGCLEARLPLHLQVQQSTLMAAVDDPRFPRLSADELSSVRIELSVLGPLQAVADVGQIEVGRHGLLIEWRGRRGTLLPQVAAEAGWDRERFLARLCAKAGLPAEQWRQADLYRYTADVFAE